MYYGGFKHREFLQAEDFSQSLSTLFLSLNEEKAISLIAPCLKGIWPGGTSVPQQQKFHTDDINQCLHKKFGSHGFLYVNLFTFMLLVLDYDKVLYFTVNELQQNSNPFLRKNIVHSPY